MAQQAQATSSQRSIIAAMVELACADTSDWDSTIRHILRVEADTLAVERVSFWEVRDEGRSLVCEMAYHRTSGTLERGSTLAVQDHADYFAAILRSAPLVVEDAKADPRVQSLRDYLGAHEISSILDFPVWVHGRFAGVLCHEHVGSSRHWNAADESFAATVAQTTAAALEAREEREARKAALRAGFLDQVSRTLSETLDVGSVIHRAISLAVPQLADAAVVYLVEGQTIRRAAYDFGASEKGAAFARQDDAHLVLPERVLARRTSILLPDVTNEAYVEAEMHGAPPERMAALRALGPRSLMAAPMFVGERIVGVVMFASFGRRYGIEDLGLTEEFVRRFAAALENARLHERAQAALHARNDFIALAGHELRTPLTALQLTAQELQRRSASASRADIERIAASIVKQTKRLDRLIARMLEATRASAERLAIVRAPADLADIVRETVEALESRLRHAGCPLQLRIEAPTVGEWDATQLEQVLVNLLDNAAKFGAGRPVEVALRRDGDHALLSVTDHGSGIPLDRIRTVFDPFERAVPLQHYGGLGLGLFIAKAIVEEHGGTLTVESRPGAWTTFTVRLPLKPPQRRP
jgi:signal transduction histidine kinase